jgi:signal peptidase II
VAGVDPDTSRDREPAPAARPARRRANLWLVALSCGVVVLDQATKALVRAQLPLGHAPVTIVPHVLWLRQVRNDGIAFGLFGGLGSLLALGSAIVALLLFLSISRLPDSSRLSAIGVALVGGGAIGNLIDRMGSSEVVDFVRLPNWPYFNVADIAITCGVVIVIVAQLRDAAREHREAREATSGATGGDDAARR